MPVKKLFHVLVVGGSLLGLAAGCNNPPKETDETGTLAPHGGNPDGGSPDTGGGAPGW